MVPVDLLGVYGPQKVTGTKKLCDDGSKFALEGYCS